MKKSLLKTMVLVAMLVLNCVVTNAVPADKRPTTVKQSNGKMLTYILMGDEKMHWAQTIDGYTLLETTNGDLVYAIKDAKGWMVASNIIASNANERTMDENMFLASVNKNMTFSQEQKQMYNKLWESKVSTKYSQPTFPSKGGVKHLLVVLVNFSDLSITTDKSVFENMCMQNNYKGTGSIHDYFYTNSNGQLDLQIDVVGPVTLPNSMSYYGKDKNYGNGYIKHDENMPKFVESAVKEAAKQVKLSKYDNDGDGIVDDVAFIYAGTPQSSTKIMEEIWPHSGTAQGTTLYDGVKVNRYTCSAEMSQKGKADATIGTFCHEFGHALGLPDWYDTDYQANGGESITVGKYSVMCEGCYNNNLNSPCLWSAQEKVMVGWMDTVIDLTGSKDSITLQTLNGKNDTAYRVWLTGTEFLMIENREKKGFDEYIPGEGMLIYHGQMNKINAWVNQHKNDVNINPADRGWFIVPSDGMLSSTVTNNAPFPGPKNITYCLDTKLINGTPYDKANITNIHKLNDSVIMFDFNSSKPFIDTKTPSKRTSHSLTVSGKIIYKSEDLTIAKKGFVYSTQEDFPENPLNEIEDTTISDTININAVIEGLTNNTTYYYRAFIEDEEGNKYFGTVNHSTTYTGYGSVSTEYATNVDSTSATLNAKLITVGDGTFVEKGFVYVLDKEDIMPTIEDATNCVKVVIDGDTPGNYSFNLTNLPMGTTCYYRAYITNSLGTYYESKLHFTTLYPKIENNVISQNQQICLGVTPEELTGEQVTGGFGNFTYIWQQQSGYEPWTEAEGVNDQETYQPTALTTTTRYRRIVKSNGKFDKESNVVVVEVKISKGGTIFASKDVYGKGESAKLVLTDNVGDVVEWLSGTDVNNLNSIGNAGQEVLDQTFTNTGKFYYQVKVQDGNCEPAMSEVKMITVDNSSINDAENTAVINIVPNPTTNGTFVINSDITNAQSMVITNAVGQVIYFENNVDLTNKVITLKDVDSGSYIINIIANNKPITNKLIINK